MENMIETYEETVSDVQGRFEHAEKAHEAILKRLSEVQKDLDASLDAMYKIRNEAREKRVPLW